MYIPKIKLSNGIEMPTLGFGTYPLVGNKLTNAMMVAVNNGYSLFDTAHAYPNEESIGKSIKKILKQTDLSRKDLFITTKVGDKLDEKGIPMGYYFYNSSSCLCHNTHKVVYTQVNDSLNKMQLDYIDLLLIHWPYFDVLNEIWECFEQLYEKKIVRAIGVSNCKPYHINRILKTAKIAPMVNQIYVSPLNTQPGTVLYCKEHSIQIEAYSPLMILNKKNTFYHNSQIEQICKKYEKTKAQIILRWNYEHGIIPIPKSLNPMRIKENIDIFDFQLETNEITLIDSMNENWQFLPESKFCPGY